MLQGWVLLRQQLLLGFSAKRDLFDEKAVVRKLYQLLMIVSPIR